VKRLLTSLCFLIVAAGCESISAPLPPSQVLGADGQVATANLAGQVSQLTADGAMPVEGALVELLQSTDPAIVSTSPAAAHKNARPADWFVVMSTVTGIEGRYAFSGVTLGTYVIHVSKGGFSVYDSGQFQLTGDLDLNAELKADENGSPSRARRR
jgi:hypothetical protein